jgi:holo-[acyl-carrier protein] synthase
MMSIGICYLRRMYQMDRVMFNDAGSSRSWHAPWLGVDVVHVSHMAESLAVFGERFVGRIFTPREALEAGCDHRVRAERFAARFAAKEAALKAFGWCHLGLSWRDIEVRRQAGGACVLALQGRAAELAQQQGITQWALSMSHDGDHAVAVVAATLPPHPPLNQTHTQA